MSFLVYIGRILAGVIQQPGVQDVISAVGRYAIRQGTAAVVRQIRNRSRGSRKGTPTVS